MIGLDRSGSIFSYFSHESGPATLSQSELISATDVTTKSVSHFNTCSFCIVPFCFVTVNGLCAELFGAKRHEQLGTVLHFRLVLRRRQCIPFACFVCGFLFFFFFYNNIEFVVNFPAKITSSRCFWKTRRATRKPDYCRETRTGRMCYGRALPSKYHAIVFYSRIRARNIGTSVVYYYYIPIFLPSLVRIPRSNRKRQRSAR